MSNQKWIRGSNLRSRQIDSQTNDTIKQNNEIAETVNSKKRSRDEYESFTFDDFNTIQSIDNMDKASDKIMWVSATGVKNYLLKDPFLDWLELNRNKLQIENNEAVNMILSDKSNTKIHVDEDKYGLNILFQQGNKHEFLVVKFLYDKCPNMKKVVTKYVQMDDVYKTFEYMKAGVLIIEQAALYNFKNKTFGVADLLVRSDYINKLFNIPPLSPEEETRKAPLLNGQYHYVVIDIKWANMHFRANGDGLRNDGRFPAYKGQLAIYNAALGQLQGYTPDKAYILAKSWKREYTKDGKLYTETGNNCFDRLGPVDFIDVDKDIIKETNDAINWVRDVRINGSNWSPYEEPRPSREELYPNMSNHYDAPFHSAKQTIAEHLKEHTMIWNVGVKHRKIAHENGIMRWDDERCCAKNMGIYGEKLGPTIDMILQVNRDQNTLILPDVVQNNTHNWKKHSELDFYIDFEDISGELYEREMNILNSVSDNKLLFIVGIGYEENEEWKYKLLLADSVCRKEEQRLINEMISFINTKTNTYNTTYNTNQKPRLFHWSPAEKTSFNAFNKRYNNAYAQWVNSITWIDMCKVFTDEPIVIKGAMKFNLKDIAKNMHHHEMIQTKWNSNGPSNGLDAMMDAIRYYHYQSDPKRNMLESDYYKQKMTSIIDYNEVDCKVVYEIVKYLRDNH